MLSQIPLPDELFSLLQAGGTVLWGIIFITFILWVLIIERCIFLWNTFPNELKNNSTTLTEKSPVNSKWCHTAEIQAEISDKTQRIFNNMSLIGGLISVFPLLGLLGTVTGMIHLFDVLAFVGNTNARAISSGVSMAIIPTVAGMFLAIVGIAFRALLLHRAKMQIQQLEMQLK